MTSPRGQYIDPRSGKLPLRAYSASRLARQTFDPSTREAVELRLRVHVYPVLGDHELRSLAQRPSSVQAWVGGLQGQPADNYVRTVFANLSAALTAAVDDGLTVRNSCRGSSHGMGQRTLCTITAQRSALTIQIVPHHRHRDRRDRDHLVDQP